MGLSNKPGPVVQGLSLHRHMTLHPPFNRSTLGPGIRAGVIKVTIDFVHVCDQLRLYLTWHRFCLLVNRTYFFSVVHDYELGWLLALNDLHHEASDGFFEEQSTFLGRNIVSYSAAIFQAFEVMLAKAHRQVNHLKSEGIWERAQRAPNLYLLA